MKLTVEIFLFSAESDKDDHIAGLYDTRPYHRSMSGFKPFQSTNRSKYKPCQTVISLKIFLSVKKFMYVMWMCRNLLSEFLCVFRYFLFKSIFISGNNFFPKKNFFVIFADEKIFKIITCDMIFLIFYRLS